MSKTLTIDDATARKIYPSAAPELKAILEDSYGKPFFSGKITDRIKTFEDACRETGDDPRLFVEGTKDEIAYKKLKVITAALNQEWTPDWNNLNQPKWYPWFYMDAPGFRFYASYCTFTSARAGAGSRLRFASEELSNYAAKQFLHLYQDYMTV